MISCFLTFKTKKNILNFPSEIIFDNCSNITISLEEKDFKLNISKTKKNKFLKKRLNKNENSFPQVNKTLKDILLDNTEKNITLKKKIKTPKNISNNNIKILIVDDHKVLRNTLKNLCEKLLMKYSKKNYEFLEANDGVDIIYYLIYDQSQNNLIKCVITDENMEYFNGSEAIKIIRKLEKYNKIKYIPIASITAFENRSMKDNLIKKGADYILSKPCKEVHLKQFFEKFKIF